MDTNLLTQGCATKVEEKNGKLKAFRKVKSYNRQNNRT